MHHALLDPYQNRHSAIHRLPAGVKAGGALLSVLAIVLLPRTAWPAYAAAAALLLLLAGLSRIPAGALTRRMLLVEPFVLGIALLSLFQPGGLLVFAATLTKSTLCLFCMVLLSSTTRFSALLRVLRHIRVPALLVTTLALMLRYLFVLADETSAMLRARRSRTFTQDRASAWRSSASVIAHLFVRSSERAERIYAAMCARGWES
jgi:cobalt/nickel transport system permease protein